MLRCARATRATVLILLCGLALPAAAGAGDAGLVVPTAARPSPWAVTFAPDAALAGGARPVGLDLSTAGLFAGVTPEAARQDRGRASASSGDQTGRTTAFVYSAGYRLGRHAVPALVRTVADWWSSIYGNHTAEGVSVLFLHLGALLVAASGPSKDWTRLRTTARLSGVLWFAAVLVGVMLSKV